MGLERTLKQVDDELDGICVQMVQLMDDYCTNIGRLERCLRDGCVHLAKSRYLMGNSSVSDLQLPTSGPYNARSTVVRDAKDGTVWLARDDNGDDPIKRFGVLVPRSLRTAQEGFCMCLESAVESVHMKMEMEKIRETYRTLKSVRNQMKNVSTVSS